MYYVTRELVGKVVCSSYVTHQKVISYSWILAIIRAYSPLKSTSSTTVFNRQNGRGTCQFHLRVTQHAAGSSFGRNLRRSVVNHSAAPYVIRHDRKSVASHSWHFFISWKLLLSQTSNSMRSRPGRGSVVNRSQSKGQSEVGRKCITAVGPWLWFWGPSLCR